MANYRMYFFENVDDFERCDLKLANDEEACSAAWALLKPGKQVEVWEGIRRVAELSALPAQPSWDQDTKVHWSV